MELPIQGRAGVVIHPIPVDLASGSPYPVHVSCFQGTGIPCDATTAKIRLPNGQEHDLATVSGAELAVQWSPEQPGQTRLEAHAHEQRNQAKVTVVDKATTVTLSANSEQLDETNPFTVQAQYDNVESDPPYIHSIGTKVIRPLRKSGESYEGTWRPIAESDRSLFLAAAPISPSTAPPTEIVLAPLASSVTASGAEIWLAVAALDSTGRINPDPSISVAIKTGDGELKPLVVAKKAGLHLVPYKPGATSGYIHLVAQSGELISEAILYQNDAQQAPRLMSPPGTSAHAATVSALRSRIAMLELTRPDVVATATASSDPLPTATNPSTSPVSTSSAKTATMNKKAPKSSGPTLSNVETAWLRVRYGLGFSPIQYASKTREGGIEAIPPNSNFSVTPIAIAAEAEAWFGRERNIGAETAIQVGFYALQLGDETVNHVVMPLRMTIAGRYRFPVGQGPWSAWAGLGAGDPLMKGSSN